MSSHFLNSSFHSGSDENAQQQQSQQNIFESHGQVQMFGENTDDDSEEDSILMDRSLFGGTNRVPVSIVPNPKRINTFGGFSDTNFLSSGLEHTELSSHNRVFTSNLLNSNHSHGNIHVGANFSNLHNESHQEISVALGITPRPTSGISDLATPGLPDTYYDHIAMNGSKKMVTPISHSGKSVAWSTTNDITTLGNQSMMTNITNGGGTGSGMIENDHNHWNNRDLDPILSHPMVNNATTPIISRVGTPANTNNTSLLSSLLEPTINLTGTISRPPGLSSLPRATSSLGLGIPSSTTATTTATALNNANHAFLDSIVSPINRPASTPVYPYNNNHFNTSLLPTNHNNHNNHSNNTNTLFGGNTNDATLEDLLSSFNLNSNNHPNHTLSSSNHIIHQSTINEPQLSSSSLSNHHARITSTTSFQYDLQLLTRGGIGSGATSPIMLSLDNNHNNNINNSSGNQGEGNGETGAAGAAAWPIPMRYQYHQQHPQSTTSPNLTTTNTTNTSNTSNTPSNNNNNSNSNAFYQHSHGGSSNNMLAGLLGTSSSGLQQDNNNYNNNNYHNSLHTPTTTIHSNGTVIIGGRGGLLNDRPGSSAAAGGGMLHQQSALHPTTTKSPVPYNTTNNGEVMTRPGGYTSPIPNHQNNNHTNNTAANNRHHHTPHSNPVAAQKLSLQTVDERAIANVILSNCYQILLDAANHGLKAVELANTLRARVGTEVLAMVRERWGGLLSLLEQHPDQFTVERVPKNDRVVLTNNSNTNSNGNGNGSEQEEGTRTNEADEVDVTQRQQQSMENNGESHDTNTTSTSDPASSFAGTTNGNNGNGNTNQTPSRCLHVGNVPNHFTEVDLMKEFEKFGMIEGIKLIVPKNQSRRFAFITYQTIPQAITAKQCLSKSYPWKSAISFAHKEMNLLAGGSSGSGVEMVGSSHHQQPPLPQQQAQGNPYPRNQPPGTGGGYPMHSQQQQQHYPRHHQNSNTHMNHNYTAAAYPHPTSHHAHNNNNNNYSHHNNNNNHNYHNNQNHHNPHITSSHSNPAATAASSSSSIEKEDFTTREQYILQRLCDDTYVPTQPWPEDEAVDRLFVQAIREQIFQFGGNYTTTISKLRGFLKHRIGTSSNIKSVPLKALLQAYPQYFVLHGNVVSLVLNNNNNNTHNNSHNTHYTTNNNHHTNAHQYHYPVHHNNHQHQQQQQQILSSGGGGMMDNNHEDEMEEDDD